MFNNSQDTPNIQVLKSGLFSKQGQVRRAWTLFYWELTNAALSFFTCDSKMLKGSILLRDIISLTIDKYGKNGSANISLLLTHGKRYNLSFESEADLIEWKQAIECAKQTYQTNTNNKLLLPSTFFHVTESIPPQLGMILQHIDELKNGSDLKHFLEDIENYITEGESEETYKQQNLINQVCDYLHYKYPAYFTPQIEDYAQSITDCFYESDSENEDYIDENHPIPELENPPFINHKDRFYFNKELGKGSFGSVYRAIDKVTGEEVAVKVIDKKNLTSSDLQTLYREVSTLNCLKHHPHIVSLKGYYQDQTRYFIVQEYCAGGELFDAIVSRQHYQESDAQHVIRTLVNTIAYCHKKKIIHRDLKPENILLKTKQSLTNIIVTDFGFARKCIEGQYLETKDGTPGYIAPEILKGQGYTNKADIWSIGVITYALVSGIPPIYGSDKEIYEQTTKGLLSFPEENFRNVSDDAKQFIRKLMTVDPDQRPSAEDCNNLNWIRYESTSTMHLDSAVRLLQRLTDTQDKQSNNSLQRMRSDLSISSSFTTPVPSTAVYYALINLELKNAAYSKALSIAVIQQGTTFSVEKIMKSNEGIWIKLTLDSIKSLFNQHLFYINSDNIRNKSILDSPPIQYPYILINNKNCTLSAVPLNAYLFRSRLGLDFCHNVFSIPDLNSPIIGKLPGGQFYAVLNTINNEQGSWACLHEQTVFTYDLKPEGQCWVHFYTTDNKIFFDNINF